ncbi:sorting nexin-32-like [Huso huso]|uniref:Sorting nexin-32-like n=1 Tax=Huso huso TaxID=61971 RepID=A0ABR0Y1A1_HUSHU
MDESQALFVDEDSKSRSVSVDLYHDSLLQVEISDAVSERDKVKFTVHTKTSLPRFKRAEFSVVRQHEEFIWLHDTYLENEDYAGIIIPPAPPKPDFEASREKLQKLGEGDGSMTREEFAKMKQELEAEYLAIFKKTVAMHEVFLQRLAAHPVLRRDHNFYVFLEYDQDLSVRGKNKKEIFGGFFKNMVKTADEALIASTSGLKVTSRFSFLYVFPTSPPSPDVAEGYIPISSVLSSLGTQESSIVNRNFLKLAELFEKLRKVEGRVASDKDLKLSDLLRYYMRDSQAAKDLLYRRARSLADYENANKVLDKARMKNKEVKQAEGHQQLCCHRFEKLSGSAKQELMDFKVRRVSAFRKNLIELTELELKHAKASLLLLRNCLISLKMEH